MKSIYNNCLFPRWLPPNYFKHLLTAILCTKVQSSCMDVIVGLRRNLSTEELMLLNCGAGEDS